MPEPVQLTNQEVEVLDVAENKEARIAALIHQRQKVIQALAQESRKVRAVPDASKEPAKSLLPRLDMLLRWMEEQLQMTPEIKDRTQIDKGLKLIFDTPTFHFEDRHIQRARELFNQYEESRWGADEVTDEDEAIVKTEDGSDGDEQSVKRRRTSPSKATRVDSAEPATTTLRLPAVDHPIFGKKGIMHGIAYTASSGPRTRKSPMLDPRYEKKVARVYGHNGLSVGAWFPMRMSALFWGAHGSVQAGIAGSKEEGAHSIVSSGHYEDLDQDHGDTLFYSGSNSHDNEDPRFPPSSTAATLALHASLRTGRPVRVLRTESGNGRYAPRCGIRYDGLYRVVDRREPLNNKGGKYEQFKLVRMEGQPPIDQSRPTASEAKDYDRIPQYY